METRTKSVTNTMVQLALLISIILIMAFTPIGYIKTLGLEITLIVIPVTVGAVILGPVSGAILGGVFGLTSYIQCFGFSPFGAALLAINPFTTFIVCMVPRVLMGWLTGIAFRVLSKNSKMKRISFAVTSLVGPLLNTLFFMGTLILFFYNSEYLQSIATELGTNNILHFVIAFVGINGLAELGANLILGTAISKALYKLKFKL